MLKGVETKINNSQKLLADTSTHLTIIAASKTSPYTKLFPCSVHVLCQLEFLNPHLSAIICNCYIPLTSPLLDSMVASFVLKFPRGVLWYWIGIGIGYWIWLWSWWCGGVWPAFLKNGTKIWQRCIKLCASPIPNSNLRLPIPIFYGIDIHAEWTKTQSNTLFRFWGGIKINILAAAMGQPNT